MMSRMQPFESVLEYAIVDASAVRRRPAPLFRDGFQYVDAMSKRSVGLRCTICIHPARPQIDLAIATGLSKRAIAQRFEVSPDAVWRHHQTHLTAEMRAALTVRLLQRDGDVRRILLEEGAAVVEALKAIRGSLFGLFLIAVDTGDSKLAAALAGRLHESLALSAKLSGELIPMPACRSRTCC